MRQTLIRAVLLAIGVVPAAAGCGTSSDEPVPPVRTTTAVAPNPTPTVTAVPPTTPARTPLPEHGPGTFTVAAGGTERAGTAGQLLRYRVEVEDGIAVAPAEFAAEVAAVLADPRGWTAGGQWSLRRVDGDAADFAVRLATPDTVDEICAQHWLDTEGEYSCRAGDNVMINLKRWVYGVPHFDGDLATYREYLVNHEVGHRLGHGHVECPRRGGPAPVMMQQTIALDGCLPNGWPYVDGELLTGPPAS